MAGTLYVDKIITEGLILDLSGDVTISRSSSSDALRITQTGSGNALVVEDSTNPDSTPFVVDASGRTIIGTTSVYSTVAVTTSITPQLQNHGTGLNSSSVGQYSWNGSIPYYTFNKAGSGGVGTYAVVSSGNALGRIQFNGADGTAFVGGALISGDVDSTVTSGSVSGRLTFATTAVGDSSPTERLRIDSAGNVGIGGTPSTYKLEVFGSTADGASIYLESTDTGTSGGPRLWLSNDSASPAVNDRVGSVEFQGKDSLGNYASYATIDGLIGSPTSGSYSGILSFNTTVAGTYAERMRIDSSGNVGIGTSSPSTQLNVSDDAPVFRLTDTDTALSDNELSSEIQFYQSDSSGAGVGASIGAYGQGSTGLLNLRFATGTNTEAMRIDSSGNVGIGTISPDVKLDVVGGATSGAVDDTAIFSGGVAGVSGSGAAIYLTGGGGVSRGVKIAGINTGGAGNAHDMTFSTSASTAVPTERMRIASSGVVSLSSGAGLSISETTATTAALASAYIGNVSSGTYTPTITSVTNVAANTAAVCQYMRVGNVVTVGGQVTIDPTANGNTEFRMSLPIASNFAATRQAGGTFFGFDTGSTQAGSISASTANDEFVFRYVANDTANRAFQFNATYLII